MSPPHTPPPPSVSPVRAEKRDFCPFCYRKSANITQLKTIVPKCLMRHCSSGAFCCNSLSSCYAFGLDSLRVYVQISAPLRLWSVHIFWKTTLHTMELYDNCTAGNINYTFRRFELSSHPLLAACIRLDKTSLGSAAPYMRNLISLQLPLHLKESYGVSYPVLDLRCWKTVSAKSAWQQLPICQTGIVTYSTRFFF